MTDRVDDAFQPLTEDESVQVSEEFQLASMDPAVLSPVPDQAEQPAVAAVRLCGKAPDGVWLYRDTAGQILFAVARWNKPSGKDIRPLAWVKYGDGRTGWAFRQHPVPRPLYGLDRLAANPSAPVVVVEGEKTADAAAFVFPDSVVTTSPAGANAAQQADWAALAGRTKVLIISDADAPGRTYAEAVAAAVLKLDGPEVWIVDSSALAALRPDGSSREAPSGWDLADALNEGWDPDALRVEVEKRAVLREPRPRFISFPPFSMDADGLTVEVAAGQGKNRRIESRWLSGPFEIIGRARDPSGTGWARWLRWEDDDGRLHEYAVPDAMLHGDGAALAATLAAQGLRIATRNGDRARFVEYLNQVEVKRRVTLVEHTGWHNLPSGQVFALPYGSIGPVGSETVIVNGGATAPYASRGTLEGWKLGVGKHTSGHARPVLAVSAAFAGPFLGILGLEGGGINLFGQSSRGKTTCGKATASVWGKGASPGYIRTWRSTANALEAAAAASTDTLLVLDEIGVADAKEASAAVYQLAAGSGKGRAARDGTMRTPLSWRSMIFSTGELPMSAKVAEDRGRRAQAGQQVRMLDIPADGGRGFGVFDHGEGDGDAGPIAEAIQRAASEHYGTAGPAFVRRLVQEGVARVAQLAREMMEGFIRQHVPANADGQVQRAAARLGLIGAAGELATAWDITPWQPKEAWNAAARALADWIAERGGVNSAETSAAVAQVRRFFEAHGDSRFEPLDRKMSPFSETEHRPVINRAGWRKGEGAAREWYVPPETWKSEVCAWLDPKTTARTLGDLGMLQRASDGFQRVANINGRSTRVYVITAAILDGEAP